MSKIDVVVTTVTKLLDNDGVKEFICGKYVDGTPRSLPDAINGEIYSPKQKDKAKKNKKKRKKKKPAKLVL